MYYDKRNHVLIISLIVLFILLFQIIVVAQESPGRAYLDSLFNVYLSCKNQDATEGIPAQTVPEGFNNKCSFELSAQIYSNFRNFTPQQQALLKTIYDRPVMQASMLSPSGRFRIHYDNSGTNMPNYDSALSVVDNVQQVALAIDSAYSFEVNFLGYPEPPTDNVLGGDNAYDIYIINMNYYGGTQPENEIGLNKWSGYIEIDNDFLGNEFYTHGLNAARVTLAHEFHHAIQMGCYALKFSDIFFHELTSTAMESFVFNTIHDYYGYLSEYFNSPGKTFSAHRGYDLAVWNIFLKEKYGFDIIKRQWEDFVRNPALLAINNSLTEYQASFKSALSEFGQWTYYTGYRKSSDKFFKDAVNYPLLQYSVSMDFNPSSFPLTLSTAPLSNQFIRIFLRDGVIVDTLVIKITNGDIQTAISNPAETLPAEFSLFSVPTDGAMKVVNNYYSKLSSAGLAALSEINFFNNQIVSNQDIVYNETDYAYPNPFDYTNLLNNDQIYLPIAYNGTRVADINIYSAGMKLVYSGSSLLYADSQSGFYIVKWNGKDNNGNKLPTGVYMFVTNSGDNIKKGKIVIENK
ncbi:MAG: MXAN_6640 family putative metalloprotease [Ignavibacteria bacterium]